MAFGSVNVPGKLTPGDIGAVPTTRKVNNKALSSDITLTASDVGAAVASHGTHVTYSTTAPVMDGAASAGSAATVARSDHKHPTDTSRAAANHTHTAADVGARPSTWTPTAADVGAVPSTRKVNNKALSSDITLAASDVGARPSTWTPTAADVGAVPTTRKVNNKPLSSDVTLAASDVGARPSTWTPTAADVGAATMEQVNAAVATKQDKLTGTEGKVIVFDSSGDPKALTLQVMDGLFLTQSGSAVTISVDIAKLRKMIGGIPKLTYLSDVGDIVEWAEYYWMVVEQSDSTYTLALTEIYEKCKFGTSKVYSGSNLASRAKAFENSLPSRYLANAINTTVNGVTAKIFVPSQSQLRSYFKNEKSRICYYAGEATQYWTSDPYIASAEYAWCVTVNGDFSVINNVGATHGFRPFVAVNVS